MPFPRILGDRLMDFLATPLGRKVLFFALHESEGAPIGFIGWYLPTRRRAAELPLHAQQKGRL